MRVFTVFHLRLIYINLIFILCMHSYSQIHMPMTHNSIRDSGKGRKKIMYKSGEIFHNACSEEKHGRIN